MKKITASRIDWLDILRGVAILMVIVVHSDQFQPIHYALLNSFALEGMRGVQLFFVISGFTVLMTYEKGRNIPCFFIKRIFRVYPLYLIFTLFWYYWVHDTKSFFAPKGFGLPELLETLCLVNVWDVRSYNAILPGGWSISAEMNMYLFVPILSSFLITLKRGFEVFVITFVVGILLSFGGYLLFKNQPESNLINAYFNSYWLPTCLPSFIAGMLAYRIYTGTDLNRKISLILLMFSVLSFAILCLWNIHLKSILCAPIFGAVVLSFGNLMRGLKFSPIFTWIGKVSYSAYFWHFIVIEILTKMSFRCPGGFLSAFLLITLITLVLSSLTYKFLEFPLNYLGHRLAEKVNSQCKFSKTV
jgi:peptidoglycan/LPS O-acetylase OafA/YrhL